MNFLHCFKLRSCYCCFPPVNSKTAYGLWVTETKEPEPPVQWKDTENFPLLLLDSFRVLLKMICSLSLQVISIIPWTISSKEAQLFLVFPLRSTVETYSPNKLRMGYNGAGKYNSFSNWEELHSLMGCRHCVSLYSSKMKMSNSTIFWIFI